MPMIIETAVAMLACARIGAIHSVVFGGFSAQELSNRIIDAQPKVIVSASCGLEPNKKVIYPDYIREAIALSKVINIKIIYYNRKQAILENLEENETFW